MGLDKSSTFLPLEIFSSICELKTKHPDYSIRKHLLPLAQGKKIVLRARSFENEISLSLQQQKKKGKFVILKELGTYSIGEDKQKFLHSSFSRLCIYTFLGVTQEDINAVLKPGKKKKKEDKKEIGEKENKLLSLEFDPEKIKKSSFETAFNTLFIAVCYSGLIKQDSGNIYLKDKMKELASEMLREIGKAAAQSLIISLASKRNQIRSEYKNLEMNGLTISYSPVISKSISCYCTRLEMDEKRAFGYADKNLEDKLNRQLFYCELGFDSVVENNGDDIEVKHTISFLHYKPIQLNSSTNSNERYFPAKISIKIWPEGDFEFINLLMGESTSDRSVTVTNTTSSQISLGVQVGTGAASLNLGGNCGHSTAYTWTTTSWKRQRDIESPGVGRQAWTLEDKFSRISAFDYEPCCRKAPAYKALGELAGSDEPFTESGGIIFEGKDGCGPPMMWEFKRPPNRNLTGKCLKWAVEVEIGVAYYGRQYMEVRTKKFGGISLVQPIEDSIQQPTLPPLVNNSPLQRTPVQHVGRTAPHPNQQQVPQRSPVQHVSRTAPRPNQQQVPPIINSPPQLARGTSARHTMQQQGLGILILLFLVYNLFFKLLAIFIFILLVCFQCFQS